MVSRGLFKDAFQPKFEPDASR